VKSRQKIIKADNVTKLEDALAAEAIDKLLNHYIPWIEKALGSLDGDDIWARPNKSSNSIANLLLHLEGNVRQWIICGLGGEKDNRQRDLEFTSTKSDNTGSFLSDLKNTVMSACEVIEKFQDEDMLLTSFTIQGFETTAFSAIFHVVEHFSYHTGQIVWIAKSISGKDMQFYNL